MTGRVFDSHAHYDDRAFDADRESLLKTLPERDVYRVVNCGTDVRTSETALALAERFDYIYAACGIHPEEVEEADEADLDRIEAMLSHPRCVAVGEIGLDYHWNTPKELQYRFFEAQLEMANRRDMPVIVHDREAHGDVMAYMRRFRPKGVLHCFSGSVETAKEATAIGLYLGFGGSVTFKNAVKPVEVAAWCPADRLLLETDCPYMAPVPMRGKRNESDYILFVAERIAQIRGATTDEILRLSRENADRLFGLA